MTEGVVKLWKQEEGGNNDTFHINFSLSLSLFVSKTKVGTASGLEAFSVE